MTNSTAQLIASLDEATRATILKELSANEAAEILEDWRFWARPDQIAPEGDWRVWLILAGRGFGKTRCGAEWVHEQIRQGRERIALVGETKADVRDVMVEGESGILATAGRNRPLYEPSKRRLTWPNGAIGVCYSGDEPDQLRGPQHDAAWLDELAKYRYAEETWSNLDLGLRLGESPQAVITTTPRPVQIMRELVADELVTVTRGSTYDNLQNLAESFAKRIVERYEGTRLGRQELHAEILDDVVGALWSREMIDAHRLRETPPHFERIVVGVDPAVTSGEDADETGILVAGMIGNRGYIVEDLSGQYTPQEWAIQAIKAYYKYNADRIVAEVNQGGDMVEHTIRTVDRNVSYKAVRAARGKILRAEPIAALYEQGRIHHCGTFAALEDQLCMYTHESRDSPDRLDALVWALTDLMIGKNDGGMSRVRGL
ncbi:MAG: DNA-packaging protein [Candidatus Latescibacterota bacterium]